MRPDEVLNCEALSGRDMRLVEYEVRVFCTSGVVVVTEPSFDGLVRLPLELCKFDEAGRPVVVVALNACCCVCYW